MRCDPIFRLISLLVLIACVGGCGSTTEEPGGCAGAIFPAVAVIVKDKPTGAFAAQGATATLIDGAFTETMSPGIMTGDGTLVAFQGGVGRPGNYTVRVTKPGYAAWERSGIDVPSNFPCSVNTVTVEADLIPTK